MRVLQLRLGPQTMDQSWDDPPNKALIVRKPIRYFYPLIQLFLPRHHSLLEIPYESFVHGSVPHNMHLLMGTVMMDCTESPL
jgi:hypothetical protein